MVSKLSRKSVEACAGVEKLLCPPAGQHTWHSWFPAVSCPPFLSKQVLTACYASPVVFRNVAPERPILLLCLPAVSRSCRLPLVEASWSFAWAKGRGRCTKLQSSFSSFLTMTLPWSVGFWTSLSASNSSMGHRSADHTEPVSIHLLEVRRRTTRDCHSRCS